MMLLSSFMFHRLAVIIFAVLPTIAQAQSFESLDNRILSVDTLTIGLENKLDSIQFSAAKEYYSLKNSYDSVIIRADYEINRMQGNIDSLQNLQLQADRFTHKLDSIEKWKDEKIKSITSKVDKLKSSVSEKVERLDLPPALQDKASELTSLMDKLDVTLPNTNLPVSFQQKLNIGMPDLSNALNGHSISNIEIPNMTNPLNGQGLQDVTNINLPSTDIGNIGNQVQQYQGQVSQLPADIDGAAKLAEDQATNISAVADVQKELGHVDELTGMAGTLQDQEKLKQELAQQAKQQVVDHFAGKEEQLQKAMESVAKYKQKYPTLNSLNDIPKKRPNEMKGKPFIERLVPGIAIQLQKKDDDLLTDFNLYFGYRFTRRFTSGAGWNQRVGYNTDRYNWSGKKTNIYGPRVFSEYKLAKGFSPRVEVEVMNTFVPPFLKTSPVDPENREWVWGAFVGMKKDYKFLKKVKGTALIMLRLFDPHHKSPYADVINARFGFALPAVARQSERRREFPMKKKVKV